MRKRHLVPVLLASLALVLGPAATGLAGRPHPLADTSDNFGQPLAAFGPTVAGLWCAISAGLLLVGGAALTAERGTALHRHRRAIVVGACAVTLLMLDHTLLMLIGYVPFLLFLVGTGNADGLGADLLSPGLGIQVATAAAVIGLLLGLRRAGDRPTDETTYDEGAHRRAADRTRLWTHIAMEAPLLYAASRVLMFFELPGFRGPGFDLQVRTAGLGLAGASLLGVLLTWGLIRPWGETFPRWVPWLGGRRVPVDLAVVPALCVAALVLMASRAIIVAAVQADAERWDELFGSPLIGLPQLLWPLWGVALGLAALAYQRRRRIGSAPSRQGGLQSSRAKASAKFG